MTAPRLYANDLILFAQIVDAGSFTKASDVSGLPKSTLSRRLTDLENQLGERLMQRTTRRLVLTEFGERILDHARRLQEETEAATALALHRQETPHGTLRVSLPPEHTALALDRIVYEFRTRYPAVRLELDLSSRRVDLLAERFDIAIRAATHLPDDSSLVARRIATLHSGLYASVDYLKRNGTPKEPFELLEHSGLMLLGSSGEGQPWQLSRGNERWEGMPAQAVWANSLGLQQSLAAKGLGIVGLSERFADGPEQEGKLQRILPDWSLPPTAIWCVTPGRRLLPQRTLAFMEVLKSVLTDVSGGRT